MPTQVQIRRGTTTQHSTFTGAAGELTVDTDKKTVVVHDASTAGGLPLLREDGSNSALALGSASAPSLKFTGDTNTGVFSPGADRWAVTTGGSQRLEVDASGRVLVGTSSVGDYGFAYIGNTSRSDTTVSLLSSAAGSINIHFGDTLSGTGQYSGYISYNHANDYMIFGTATTERMRIQASGDFDFKSGVFTTLGTYNYTTSGGAANVHIDAAYQLRRATSCARYKTDVETIEESYSNAILNCRPVWYRSLCEGDNPQWGFYGFLAEEVEQVDRRLCTYEKDPENKDKMRLSGVQYDRFVPLLLDLIKRQKEQIKALEARLTAAGI